MWRKPTNRRESPHKLPVPIFKEQPVCVFAPRQKRNYSPLFRLVNTPFGFAVELSVEACGVGATASSPREGAHITQALCGVNTPEQNIENSCRNAAVRQSARAFPAQIARGGQAGDPEFPDVSSLVKPRGGVRAPRLRRTKGHAGGDLPTSPPGRPGFGGGGPRAAKAGGVGTPAVTRTQQLV